METFKYQSKQWLLANYNEYPLIELGKTDSWGEKRLKLNKDIDS